MPKIQVKDRIDFWINTLSPAEREIMTKEIKPNPEAERLWYETFIKPRKDSKKCNR